MSDEKKQIAQALRAAQEYLQDGITHQPRKRYQICLAIHEAFLQGKTTIGASRAATRYVMGILLPRLSVVEWLERERCVNFREKDVYYKYMLDARYARMNNRTRLRKPPEIVRWIMDYRHRWLAHMIKELT